MWGSDITGWGTVLPWEATRSPSQSCASPPVITWCWLGMKTEDGGGPRRSRAACTEEAGDTLPCCSLQGFPTHPAEERRPPCCSLGVRTLGGVGRRTQHGAAAQPSSWASAPRSAALQVGSGHSPCPCGAALPEHPAFGESLVPHVGTLGFGLWLLPVLLIWRLRADASGLQGAPGTWAGGALSQLPPLPEALPRPLGRKAGWAPVPGSTPSPQCAGPPFSQHKQTANLF